jgi:hypothetical protein
LLLNLKNFQKHIQEPEQLREYKHILKQLNLTYQERVHSFLVLSQNSGESFPHLEIGSKLSEKPQSSQLFSIDLDNKSKMEDQQKSNRK